MATTRRFKDESAIIYSLYEGMNQRGWACMREAVGSRQQTNGQTGISKRWTHGDASDKHDETCKKARLHPILTRKIKALSFCYTRYFLNIEN
jgi:hypothetical protein